MLEIPCLQLLSAHLNVKPGIAYFLPGMTVLFWT